MLAAIPLSEMVIDPDHDIDLAAMPEDEAIALIKKSMGFLSSEIEVSIKDGVAYINWPDEKAARADEAAKMYDRAVKQAQQGDYNRAVQSFRRVLAFLPNHIDARRNLAMAYLELGDKETAKNVLIEVLKLAPKDSWSYLLLGNIHSKYEKDFVRAEKWYRKAFELDPKDAILLTNYGAVMLERGEQEQAAEFFERAIEANPQYPNSYYALAMLDMKQEKPEQALALLDDLFAKANPGDVRSVPLYAEARKMYLEVNRRVADRDYTQFMQAVDERKRTLEAREGGYPIDIIEDNSLDYVSAVSQMAWKHRRDQHIIRYRNRTRAMTPHLVAHELEHIELEEEARNAKRNRLFSTTAKTRELAIRSISDDVYRLRNMGMPEADITKMIVDMIDGMANHLFNTPLDMVIETRLYQHLPAIRPSQFASLNVMYGEALHTFTSQDIKRLTPRRIWRASATLNCAYALFLDSLYQGKTDYAQPYRSSELMTTAQKLFGMWQDAMAHFQPGDEYDLVTQYAKVLRLDDWYEWRADESTGSSSNQFFVPDQGMPKPHQSTELPRAEIGRSQQGATNPELLKAKEPAAVMYLLSALERFDRMTTEQITRLGTEIAIVGMEGIDYTSSEKTYTLPSLPGETFSGLQLLCLMYAAFQVIDPSLNVGADLKDAYRMAQNLYRAKDS